jgi:hypothetical protein
MRDFTLITYRNLLETLLQKGYEFIRFDEYIISLQSRWDRDVAKPLSSVASQQSSMDQNIEDRCKTETDKLEMWIPGQAPHSGRRDDNPLSAKLYTLSPKCILSI